MRRITIHGIREHPWFTVDLPDYLFPLGDPGASQMDNLALSEVCQKLGVSPHEVVAAVKGGEQLGVELFALPLPSCLVHVTSTTYIIISGTVLDKWLYLFCVWLHSHYLSLSLVTGLLLLILYVVHQLTEFMV